jgi:hypothetical protein
MERKKPEITINKFAECLNASEKKKEGILRAIKFSDDGFRRNRYNTPKSAILLFLTDPEHNVRIFEEKKTILNTKRIKTDWERNDRKNSLAALKSLEVCVTKIFPEYLKYDARRVKFQEVKKASVYGVQIDLNPDLLLFMKNSDEIVGAVKFIFSRSRNITPMEGQIIAGFIKSHIEKKLKVPINEKNVFAVDVFGKKKITAPSDYNYHQRLTKSLCEYIATNWPRIKKK